MINILHKQTTAVIIIVWATNAIDDVKIREGGSYSREQLVE